MPKVNISLKNTQWAITELFLNLPVQDFLSAIEIKELLVNHLGVCSKLTVEDLRSALRQRIGDLITIRNHGTQKTKYYAKTTNAENCIPFDQRPKGWQLPVVDVQGEEIDKSVKLINEFYNVEPATITPEKSKMPVLKICAGFTGPEEDELFRQSLVSFFLDWDMSTAQPLPTKIGLPKCLLHIKGSSSLEFVQQKDFSWKLVSKSCVGIFEKNRTQAYCTCCSSLRDRVRDLCRPIASIAADKVTLTDRSFDSIVSTMLMVPGSHLSSLFPHRHIADHVMTFVRKYLYS